ncbi:hypothetical protein NFI96_011756 [Prochilodus magdalenae]|nr:hypothetical protein NFI96_011756 [Prochilodus magdalenae]
MLKPLPGQRSETATKTSSRASAVLQQTLHSSRPLGHPWKSSASSATGHNVTATFKITFVYKLERCCYRNSTLPGRREDGFSGDQYHSSVRSDSWRSPESVNKMEGKSHWGNGPSQGEEEVDHWAKFIEAIGHAERRRPTPMLRYQTQDDVQRFDEKSTHSPRRLPRERLSSPDASRYGPETHQRIPSPGRRRNEHDGAHLNRHYSNRSHWDSRDSGPRHSREKRPGRVEHIHQHEQHEERYHERGSFSERSLKSNYREDHPHPKRFRGLDPQEQCSVTHRGFSPHNSPVIVEHDHGMPYRDGRNRSPPRSRDPIRNQERSRSRDLQRVNELPQGRDPPRGNDLPWGRDPPKGNDLPRGGGPPRGNGLSRNREPLRGKELSRNREPPRGNDLPPNRDPPRDHDFPQNRDPPRVHGFPRGRGHARIIKPPSSMESFKNRRAVDQHTGITRDGRGGSAVYHDDEETRLHHPSAKRGSPIRGRLQHQEKSRMDAHARPRHGKTMMDLNLIGDVDLRNDQSNRPRFSGHAWKEEKQPGGKHGRVLEPGKFSKGIPHHRNLNTKAASTTQMDLTEHETLRIKVDMSRPVGLSSHLGYSSERQLSLDLVNVGRQRLDFLPMLEHSGTYRESSTRSGTFAQEIITLVHHVKENYFQGQGITLNERFSSEQHYTLLDEQEISEEEQELEESTPVINRPPGGPSETQIYCKIGSWQPQRRQTPAPGDLRHDLERKRQQRLEGVKITISGGSFSQMAPQSQENEPAYMEEDDVHQAGDDFNWSEQMPQQTEQWDGPPQKMRLNFDARQNFHRFGKRRGSSIRRNPDNDANW